VVVVVGGSVVVVVGGDVVLVVVGGDVVVVVGTGSWVVCVCAEFEGVLLGTEVAPTLVPAPSTMTRHRESKRTALANKTLPSLAVQRPLRTPIPTSLLSVAAQRQPLRNSVECGPALTALVIKAYAGYLVASSDPLRRFRSADHQAGGANWPHG
jgi:hypothetical protein